MALMALVCAGSSATRAQLLTPVSNIDEIDVSFRFGSGTNKAAMVVQWNDSQFPSSEAWQYQWNDGAGTGPNGTTTSLDMIKGVAGTVGFYRPLAGGVRGDLIESLDNPSGDPRLKFDLLSYSFGETVYSISFTKNSVTRARGNFLEGSYWESYNFGGSFVSADGDNSFSGSYNAPATLGNPSWTYTWSGVSDRGLTDGSWDGYYFAVPEPSVWSLISACIFVSVLRKIRRATLRI